MSAFATPTRKIWPEADIEALPDDGCIHEIVDGELIMSPKNNFEHEEVSGRLFLALATFNRERRLGVVLGSSAGFWMKNRNCRAPDISFITKERLLSSGFTPRTRRFFPGAPDLAVEVLAPFNTRMEIDQRLSDFFTSGTQLAWIINPELQCVEVCHAVDKRQLVGVDGELDGEQLLPGFRFQIAELFRDWEWQ